MLVAVIGVVSLATGAWPIGLALLVVGVLYFFITTLQVRSMFRRNPRASVENHATLDAEGLHVHVADARTDIAWHAFDGWLERPRSFILRFGKTSSTPVIVLPKRGLSEPATVDQLRTVLERNL